jgi:hypothetical protein
MRTTNKQLAFPPLIASAGLYESQVFLAAILISSSHTFRQFSSSEGTLSLPTTSCCLFINQLLLKMEQTNAFHDQLEIVQAAYEHADAACCDDCAYDCAARSDAERTRDWVLAHAIIVTPRTAIGTPVDNTFDATAGNINEIERQRSMSPAQQATPPATARQRHENRVHRDQHPDQLAPIDAGRQELAVARMPLPGVASILRGAYVPVIRDAQALVQPADMQVERRTLDPGLRPTPDHWVSRQDLTPGHREARLAALRHEIDLHNLDMWMYENQMRLFRYLHGL